MKKRIFGLVAAALLASGSAFAAPAQLSSGQPSPAQLSNAEMDKVSAGFLEIDISNTSYTVVSLFQTPSMFVAVPNNVSCSNCYLLIITPRLSVGSRFGP